ncbi:hypothetical protein AAVH_37022, partial [Aphelenchoides avenae]
IIHLNGFSAQEMMSMRTFVYDNVVFAMDQLLKGMAKLSIPLPLGCELPLQADAECVYNARSATKNGHALTSLPEHLYRSLKRLWRLPGAQAAYERSNEFQLIDCAQ